MAKPPASPGETVKKKIAIEWRGPQDDEGARLFQVPPQNVSSADTFVYLSSRIEIGELKIVDAIEIPARGKDIHIILSDYTVEIGRPQVVFYDTLILTDEIDNLIGDIHGITIFPAEYLNIEAYCQGFFKRKILRCIADRSGKESPALEQVRDIAETISGASPADEPPAPDTVTDAAETVEAGTAGLIFPPGFKVVKRPYKSNRQGETKPMTDETLKRFIQYVLPYIKEVGAHNAPPERWELAKKRGTPHPERGENAIIRYDGIDYVIYVNEKLNRFGVKLDKLPPGEPGKPAFFYFIGKVEPS